MVTHTNLCSELRTKSRPKSYEQHSKKEEARWSQAFRTEGWINHSSHDWLGPHLVSLWPQRDMGQLSAPMRLDQRQPCSFLGGVSSVEISPCLTSCLCPKVIGRTLRRQGQLLWVFTKCYQWSFLRSSATSRAWNNPWIPAAMTAKLFIMWRLHGPTGCLLPACPDSPAGLQTTRGMHTPQDWTLGRNTLTACRVEMKEKIVCNWQLPSWVLSSWEVSAWTFRCSSQTVKPLPETDFGLLGWGAGSVAAGARWQACSDQRRDASHLPGKLVDEHPASVGTTEPLQGLSGWAWRPEDHRFRLALLKCFDVGALETG